MFEGIAEILRSKPGLCDWRREGKLTTIFVWFGEGVSGNDDLIIPPFEVVLNIM
jgi:hypothetical protein